MLNKNSLFKYFKGFFFFLWFGVLPIHVVNAQDTDLSLSSPYQTIYTHLYNLQTDSYFPQVAATTITAKDSISAIKLAIKLKQILDGKGLFVQMNQLPQDGNYTDSISGKAVYVLFPKELPQVYLEKSGDKWHYSSETASVIPGLHKQLYPFGSDLLLNFLPKSGQNLFLGLAIWQYLGIAILLVLALILFFLLNFLLKPLINKLTRSDRFTTLIPPKLTWSISRLLSVLIIVRLLLILNPILQLPIGINQFLVLGLKITSVILIMLVLLRLVSVFILHAKRWSQSTQSKLDEQLVPIFKRTLQSIVVIGAIIQILGMLEVNVTALIAGISIGGLALALAAQDTVKNLIGSAMIFIDRPFQIGDFISGNDFSGTVQEVGFRTTRLKTADSSIIAVPNGTIANISVTNMGVRVYRLFTSNLGITYDTPPDLIETFIKGLRMLIEKHPKTSSEQYYVHLNGLEASSITIFFRAFLLVDSYAEELQVKEDLIMGMLKLADALQVSFAFPTSTVYVEDFPGREPVRTKGAKESAIPDQKLEDFFANFADDSKSKE